MGASILTLDPESPSPLRDLPDPPTLRTFHTGPMLETHMTVENSLLAGFTHRHNADHSIDSICRICFRSVATVFRERELRAREQEHDCDGFVRDYFLEHRQGAPACPRPVR